MQTCLVLLRSLNIALMTLRNCGIMHLDLKPENVLICSGGDTQRI